LSVVNQYPELIASCVIFLIERYRASRRNWALGPGSSRRIDECLNADTKKTNKRLDHSPIVGELRIAEHVLVIDAR
jgi:hypothetical protein